MTVAICLPTYGPAVRRHERALQMLQACEREWCVLELDSPNLESARNIIAEGALRFKFQTCLWLDSDIVFKPESARMLVTESRARDALVGGIYVRKELSLYPELAMLPETTELSCFEQGGVHEVAGLGFGFVAHPVHMLEGIANKLGLRHVKYHGKRLYRPWFTVDPRWSDATTDDFAFCRRAREAGYKLYVDTRHELRHVGLYDYKLSTNVIYNAPYVEPPNEK